MCVLLAILWPLTRLEREAIVLILVLLSLGLQLHRYMFGALKVLAVEWEWPKIVLGCLFCLSFFEYEGLVVPNDFITSYNPGYNKGDIKFGRIYQNK